MKANGEDIKRAPSFRGAGLGPKRLAEAKKEYQEKLKKRRKEIAKRAMELGKKYHLGALRKGFATEALKNGVDTVTLSHILGHRDPSMVSRVYGQVQLDPNHMANSVKKAKGS
jgi:integrase